MKFDMFTKVVLTVIAGALVWNAAKDLLPSASAQQVSPLPVHFEKKHDADSLAHDPTFKRAVQIVIQRCGVSGGSIVCRK